MRLLLGVAAVLLLSCGSHVPQNVSPPPPVVVAPTPTELPSTPPTPGPGQATIVGRVTDVEGHVLGGALVQVSPFALETFTDGGGRFTFANLAVPKFCRWMTIVVSKSGWGRLRTIDNPLYQGLSYADLTLRREEQELFQGPPQVARDQGERYCDR